MLPGDGVRIGPSQKEQQGQSGSDQRCHQVAGGSARSPLCLLTPTVSHQHLYPQAAGRGGCQASPVNPRAVPTRDSRGVF